jgi:NADPH:quinone reductase-like Zn-dependent oxidoreductase
VRENQPRRQPASRNWFRSHPRKADGESTSETAPAPAIGARLADRGVHPVVDRVFPFEQARDALRYLESGAHFGEVCVRA